VSKDDAWKGGDEDGGMKDEEMGPKRERGRGRQGGRQQGVECLLAKERGGQNRARKGERERERERDREGAWQGVSFC